MGILRDAADWFDRTARSNGAFLENMVFRPMEQDLRDIHELNLAEKDIKHYLALGAVGGLRWGYNISSTVAQGVIDVVRTGDGIQKRTVAGFAEDGLRVLSIAPAAGKVLKYAPRALSFLVSNGRLGNCGWIAGAKALRQTGVRLWATVGELARAPGASAITQWENNIFVRQTGGLASVADLEQPLNWLGARTKLWKLGAASIANRARPAAATGNALLDGALGSISDMKQQAKILNILSQDNGVALIGLEWTHPAFWPANSFGRVGHALLAFLDVDGKTLLFADRSGKVVKNLAQLDRLYPGISTAKLAEDVLFVKNAAHIDMLNRASRAVAPLTEGLIGQLALPVKVGFMAIAGQTPSLPVFARSSSTARSSAESSAQGGEALTSNPASPLPQKPPGRFYTDRTCSRPIPNSDSPYSGLDVEVCTGGSYFKATRSTTLSEVAQHAYGDWSRWREIYEANKDGLGENPNSGAKPGQTLVIP